MRLLYVLISVASISLATACEEIEERSWCHEICEKLRECSDAELGVDSCADRCSEAIDEGDVAESDAEDCAECVDDATCREVPDECRVCGDILPAFTSRTFE